MNKLKYYATTFGLLVFGITIFAVASLFFPSVSRAEIRPLAVVEGHKFYYDNAVDVQATDDGVIIKAIIITDDKAFNFAKAENYQLFATEVVVYCRNRTFYVSKVAMFATDGSLIGKKVFDEKATERDKIKPRTLPDYVASLTCPTEL